MLKDAAATAIYGSQGANGVIEIKTKRGKRGAPAVSYSLRLTGTYQPEGYKMLTGDEYTICLLYTSTSVDNEEGEGYQKTIWQLYTTTDMVNWTDCGTVASLADFSWAGDNGAWAPHVVPRDGKWYMYAPIQLRGIGVLVGQSPCGPWRDPLQRALINHDIRDIDPTVFIDDDGQAYLLSLIHISSNPSGYAVPCQS